jgi:Uma2 family endonuclease
MEVGMSIIEPILTVDAFEQWAIEPAQVERNYEFIAGEIVPVVANQFSSVIANIIGGYLMIFVKQNRLGWVTGADGGYRVNQDNYIPDVGFITRLRQPEACKTAYNPLAPDLAVEVLSPTDTASLVRLKLMNYIAAGTIVWLVDPEARQIEVYAPGHPAAVIGIDGAVDGGTLLPGFRLAVSDIFEGIE